MNTANLHRYGSRAIVDQQAHEMAERIVAERRSVIGVMAARRESWEAVTPWQRSEYTRIENEVEARWGFDA